MSNDTPTETRLRFVNNGTKQKPEWAIRGPIDLVRAAAQAGEAEIVKVQHAHVDSKFYDLGDGIGELIVVKPPKAAKAQPTQRVLVDA